MGSDVISIQNGGGMLTSLIRRAHGVRTIVGRLRKHSVLKSDWFSVILTCRKNKYYSRFQVTFHCKIPNFVAKFGSSLRSSKVHFRIRKPVCKLSIWLASLSSGANHSLCLQTGLWILKWTFELRNEIPNFTTKFGTLQWKVIWNRL